ncbi:MAG: large subunit ribosomal protein L15e [Candidatus Woesearchaeota archaeon]|nr:large subunit ribosomal protein L15e [Candidatus Woesearchaeota archaeon]
MGIYKYLREEWKKPDEDLKGLMKERLQQWSKEPSILRIDRPDRLDRARALGYKAKKGVVVVRCRIKRGGKTRPLFKGGRKSKNRRRSLVKGKNYRWMAEERVQRKFPNLNVLNSYWVAKDKSHYYYNVIMVDPEANEIKNDKALKWITKNKHKGRVFRGKTTAGRKSRGLLNKGKGAEKVRPSKRGNLRRRK